MNKNNNENENEERSERSEESDNDEGKEIDESDEEACTTVRNTWKSLSPKVTTEKDLIVCLFVKPDAMLGFNFIDPQIERHSKGKFYVQDTKLM